MAGCTAEVPQTHPPVQQPALSGVSRGRILFNVPHSFHGWILKAVALTVAALCRADLLFTHHHNGETKAQLPDRLPTHLTVRSPDDAWLHPARVQHILKALGESFLRGPRLLLKCSLLSANGTGPVGWEIDWRMLWVQGNNSPEHCCNRIIHCRDIFPCQRKCN